MKEKIVIADDEPITRQDLREILEIAGYNVVADASDGFDAVELCRKFKPDLVLMDIKMPLLDGLNASKIITSEGLAGGVILLTAYSDEDFIAKAKKSGVIGYLVKPIDERSLIPSIEISLSKCVEINRMKEDIKKANKKLEDRKIIEKAKGILMEKENLSEKTAFERIRTLSMNKRCSMKDIAEAIVISYEE
ncbi:response regulator [Oceanotoga sp. DSM 15011]|jgi:response regulator NasT|nr:MULTISPECIES: response regulator [Oceanotoga]MDN5341180.1 two-component system, response regulator PdtaR [Oceanotoga sp.]MDO7976861.1 response regulator [Oceanotoga teriensis]UYP00836.1 response regulator [Oceanotoga sp. DSM 15011]